MSNLKTGRNNSIKKYVGKLLVKDGMYVLYNQRFESEFNLSKILAKAIINKKYSDDKRIGIAIRNINNTKSQELEEVGLLRQEGFGEFIITTNTADVNINEYLERVKNKVLEVLIDENVKENLGE